MQASRPGETDTSGMCEIVWLVASWSQERGDPCAPSHLNSQQHRRLDVSTVQQIFFFSGVNAVLEMGRW